MFRGKDFLAALDQHAREAVGMLLIRLHGQANGVNEMFWGLWLLRFGWLVARLHFLPRSRSRSMDSPMSQVAKTRNFLLIVLSDWKSGR